MKNASKEKTGKMPGIEIAMNRKCKESFALHGMENTMNYGWQLSSFINILRADY